MNKRVWISVSHYLDRFIHKCMDNHLFLKDIIYIDQDNLRCLINLNDYKKIKSLNYYSDIKIISYDGLNGIMVYLKQNFYSLIIIFLCFILLDVLTSYILDVDVIHENKMIRDLVSSELDKYGVKKNHLAYDYNYLEKIRKQIILDHPDKLEWLSITRKGMHYIVRVEERIINNKPIETGFRNIIAKHDAYITKVICTKGEVLVRSGDYVKKGDILISGEIKLYDKVMGNTLATGSIYGNVWYEAEIKMPKVTYEEVKTGKSRYNLNINNKILFKNKYLLFKQENIRELNILGIKIKFYKEEEYQKVKHLYQEKDALNELIKKFKLRLKQNGKIISQKVLKKDENNSTITYRVFIITNELISDYSYYMVGENNDS